MWLSLAPRTFYLGFSSKSTLQFYRFEFNPKIIKRLVLILMGTYLCKLPSQAKLMCLSRASESI